MEYTTGMDREIKETKGRRHISERIDWNLLRTFVFIVQMQGIGKAAEALSLSQPAVSQALGRLEQALDGVLLHRRQGDFRLTSLGEEVYAIGRDMFSTAARLDNVSSLTQKSSVFGTLRLLVMSKVKSSLYDEFLAQFYRRYPSVEFRVEVMQSSAILEALERGVPALGICMARKFPAKLQRLLFLRHRYAIVCGRHHPLFKQQRPVELQDLLHQGFVGFESDQIGDTLSPLTIFRDEQGFDGRIIATSQNIEEIHRMIVAGLGLGFLPEHLIVQDVLNGDLKRLLPSKIVAELDVFLVWHPERRMSLVEQVFLEEMQTFLQGAPLEARAH